jgi:hypothetical protein
MLEKKNCQKFFFFLVVEEKKIQRQNFFFTMGFDRKYQYKQYPQKNFKKSRQIFNLLNKFVDKKNKIKLYKVKI